MNSGVLLGLVLLAAFAVCNVALSAVSALWWRAAAGRVSASRDLLALRLLPAAGALLLALAVVLPAFLAYEPHDEREAAGPLLWALAVFALFCIDHGVRRGVRACRAARALLARCPASVACEAGPG